MPIRQRTFAGIEPVHEIEVNDLAAFGNDTETEEFDLRGTFDPALDPYPKSYLDDIAPDDTPRRTALSVAARLAFTQPSNVPLPKDMSVQDLLAQVRVTNNGRDTVETRYRNRIKSPLTAIRAWCVESMGGSPKAVNECSNMSCPFWSFRMGRNTWRGRKAK